MTINSFTDKSRIPLTKLAIPIFIENTIRISLVAIDQFMLYSFSEKAVAALGVVNQLAFFMQIIYLMIAIGASIHISQNLGAGNTHEARMISLASFVMVGITAAVLSIVIVIAAPFILKFYPIEKEVYDYACQFLIIFGGGSIFMALNLVQSNILRSYGHVRDPMIVNAISLVFMIIGNSFCLYGFFGFPILGVRGVASVTVLSQFLVLWILGICILVRKDIKLPFKQIFKVPGDVYKKIASVGIPTAGENLSYNMAQIVIIWFISGMGTFVLAAYSLVMTLSRYVFISSLSIGTGTQIKVGFFVGSRKEDEAYTNLLKYLGLGLSITLSMVILLNIFKGNLISIFTKNDNIITVASSVLLVSIFLETGRNNNLIIIPGLKGAGDVLFPVIVGIISMWGIGVVGAYVIGVVFKLGLVGVWIAIGMDEWTRSIVMFFRWRSGAWRNKRLVTENNL